MTDPFVDTDVVIRLLTGDDTRKQADARALFKRVEAGQLTVEAPSTVIADAVFVLSSPRLYNLTRADVQALLAPLLRLPGFRVQHRHSLVRALEIFATTKLDFGDAFIVASMREAGADVVYSYDHDFDRIRGIIRVEPS
jgi:predicted nucleic acid-binding protein